MSLGESIVLAQVPGMVLVMPGLVLVVVTGQRVEARAVAAATSWERIGGARLPLDRRGRVGEAGFTRGSPSSGSKCGCASW